MGFIEDPTLFDDKAALRELPAGASATNYPRASDLNALKDAALDLRTEAIAMAEDISNFVLGTPSASTALVTATGSTTARTLADTQTHAVVPGSGGNRSIVGNPDTNTIATDSVGNTISGGGNSPDSPNIIGTAPGKNVWVATIGGGYDNQSDGTASTIGGGAHHRITPVSATLGHGHHGTIGGGSFSTLSADGDYNTIGGGTQHVIDGTSSSATIAGGNDNTVSANRGSIIGGQANTVTGVGGSVLGGLENVAAGQWSTASGYGGKATFEGQRAHGVSYFGVAGDAQGFDAVLKRVTTDGSAASMTIGTAGTFMVLPDNTTWAFDALIVGRNTAADEHAAYKVSGLIKRDSGAGTVALVGSVTTTVIAETVAAWTASATAETATGDLRIRVTGEAGKTIRWSAFVHAAAVTGP
jgi:hypothetical protein